MKPGETRLLVPLVVTRKPQLLECPIECECEKAAHKNQTTIAVYCHKGGLNDSRFGEILIHLPISIETIDVFAPAWRPINKIKWNDNLNRFRELKALRLVSCQIPSMSRSVRLPNLELLDLRQNNIDHATMGNFAGLPNLRTLDLSSNKLNILPTGVFTYLKSLKTLSLANNSMQDLPTNLLHGLRNLKSLRLDGNRLPTKHVNDLFTDVPQLEELFLNDCSINTIANLSLNRVPLLRNLGMGGNNLRHVPSTELEALPHLQILDLSNNAIGDLPPCVLCANNITHLDLSHNLLGIGKNPIHEEAFRDTKVEFLDLSHNHLNDFDSNWLGHAQETIKELGFSGNFLRTFPPEITHSLRNLKRLHMGFNHIDWWPIQLPAEYNRLEFFNVSGNQFSNLPDNIGSILSKVKELDISRNRLSALSHAGIVFVNDIKKVHLHGNPWDCSCSIQHLQQHMRERYPLRHLLHYDETQCNGPALLKGQPLLNVAEVSDCAVLFGARYGLTQSSELLILLAAIVSAAILLCLIMTAMYYTRERHYKGTYVTREHSRTPLTMSHPMSLSPSSQVSEPLSPTSTLPPPPPKASSSFFGI
ncbi:unnamed protein product, partial [Mesorhabditis belari]|uniref:LRRCT domain-containing protein n=1 Tax=Mesorhabditis belari TaxID=2138241 RepID=A0AAF3J5W3_9BILA